MASAVEICNRALQKLGAKRIVALSDDSVNARACNVAYEPTKLKLLRQHVWTFAISRATLAADSVAPTWGRANAFQLPSDFIRLTDDYPERVSNAHDFEIEGRKILTNDGAPLEIRYVKDVTDPNEMDSLFRELFATDLAIEICHEITQSNTQKAQLIEDRKEILKEAKRANAIERVSAEPPADTWLTARS